MLRNLIRTSKVMLAVCGSMGALVLFVWATVTIPTKGVVLDNSYGYPTMFVIGSDVLGHKDPGFGKEAKMWCADPADYGMLVIETGITLEEAKSIELYLLK